MIDLTKIEAFSEEVKPHIDINPLFIPKSVRSALECPDKEPEEVIEGILHRGCKLIFNSTSKAGKSWALMQLGFAVANGEKWIDYRCKKGNVLHVDFEIKESILQRRFAGLSRQLNKQRPDNMDYIALRGKNINAETLASELSKLSTQKDYSLIILDPIYKIQAGDENSAKDINVLCNMLDKLAEDSNAAVAYSHHFAKGNYSEKSSIDRASGSGVFARDPDAILVMTPLQEEYTYLLESTLRNFPPVPSIGVRKEGLTLLPDYSLDTKRIKGSRSGKPAPTDAEILQILPEQGSEDKVNHSDLKELIAKYEFPRDKTLKKINVLSESGLIVKLKEGKSTNYYSVKK
jgi:hypothetical protein